MRAAWIAVLLLGCGGPLAGARLEPLAESQRRALLTATLPALERTEAQVRAWGSDPEASPLRELLLRLHGVPPEAAAQVDTAAPIGLSLTPGAGALAFALREEVAPKEWLEGLGSIAHRSGAFFQIDRADGALFVHLEGSQLILSRTLAGLQVAGPAAREARRAGAGDLLLTIRPPAWPRERRGELGQGLARFLDRLRLGDPASRSPVSGLLAAADALHHLQPLLAADAADLVVKLSPAGAELHLRTTGGDEPRLTPLLDVVLVEDGVAALGALDCRRWLGERQRRRLGVWQANGGPGARELGALVDAEQADLEGTCSFAVHTAGELWAEEASYPLARGADGEKLLGAIAAAIRSGGLPSLDNAGDDVPAGKVFLDTNHRGALILDRVLGQTTGPQARHAAAFYGGTTLRDGFAIRNGHLLVTSGARADARIQRLTEDRPPRSLPVELERALAAGRGRRGFLFLDLAGLWKPYLKAAQVIRSPLSEMVARNPALFTQRRPLVLTLDGGGALDATVSLPPATVSFLVAVAALLFP